MPGRASARSTRSSSATVARKSSAATLKSRGSASARTSAHAVEVPDEGPDTSLRGQICQIFSDAQNTTATQRKLQANLRKIQERCCFQSLVPQKKRAQDDDEFEEEDFINEVTRCLVRVMAVKKGEPVADRVIRFICLFLKHASEKDRSMYQTEDEADTVHHVETATSRLLEHVLTTLLGFLAAKDKVIRFRAAQTIAYIINDIDAIDEDMFSLIRLSFLKRLRDKEPSVRVQAALGLMRLANEDSDNEDEDSDDDVAGGILNKLMDIMINDPSAEVRRAVLRNLPFHRSTLRYILERARDIDVSMRRLVYHRILPNLGDFRHMSLVEREKLLRWGLRDRDETVRKAAARLFYKTWLENCASSYDTRPEEEKTPGDPIPVNLAALGELLERLDVTNSGVEEGIAHEAMRVFWEQRPDYLAKVDFDKQYWLELDPPKAFVARSLNDYRKNTEDDRLRAAIEDKMPDIGPFVYIIERQLNMLIEARKKTAEIEAAMDDQATGADQASEADQAREEEEESNFIVQQLLHISLTLDYCDEVGRQNMYNLMRGALAKAELPEECTKLAVEVLRVCCPGARGESEFCALILEAIQEVRDTLMEDDPVESPDGDGADESFHSARSDVGSDDSAESGMLVGPSKRGKTPASMDPKEEEEKRNRMIYVVAKCLHIAQCALQNVRCDPESNDSLKTIVQTVIEPAIHIREAAPREGAVTCLGLVALLSKDYASKFMAVFFRCFTMGHDTLKVIVIQALADIFITHPSLLAPPAPEPETTAEDTEPKTNPFIKPLSKVLLKAFRSDDKYLSLTACTAASKLLLLGILPSAATANLLKEFAITYFDPETAANPAVRQALSYFLPVFCHSKLRNALLMAQISVIVMSNLLRKREDFEEEADEMVGWPVITAHIAEWTDGRRVVGATELDVDGKTSTTKEAEGPHIYLATEILEKTLSHSCSKDERKPLLSLLSKLYIAPSGPAPDEEALRSLHSLVTEAVEGKLAMDATQRNYLTKLEISLNKRLGDVEHVTQVANSDDNTVTPETTEVAETPRTDVPEQGDDAEREDDDEEDTMMAGIQCESTRIPLEEEEDDEEGSPVVPLPRRVAVTEDDIVDSLLETEMSE